MGNNCTSKSAADSFGDMSAEETHSVKTKADELHRRKIDLADEILILDVDGYVGSSTKSEIEYARQHDKRVRWLGPPV
jgi:hypothetical protein